MVNGHADLLEVEQPTGSPDRKAVHSAEPGIRRSAAAEQEDESERPPSRIRMTRSARPATAAGGRPGTASGKCPSSITKTTHNTLSFLTVTDMNLQVDDQVLHGQRHRGSNDGNCRRRTPLRESTVPILHLETANLIVSAGDGDDSAEKQDDEENFIVEESALSMADTLLGEQEEMGADADQMEAEDHGGLVRTILETKKALESGLEADSGPDRPLVVYDEKEREKTRKEMGKLQDQVQQLTKTAHPLGRLVDYLQEDIDSMMKELEQWRGDAKKNAAKLRQTHGSERADLEPAERSIDGTG